MILKLFGAALVLLSCGGVGFSMAARHRREVCALQNLISAIDRIVCELEYKLSPLPELLRVAGNSAGGVVGEFFLRVSDELTKQLSPNAADCFCKSVLSSVNLPDDTRKLLLEMGMSIGQYDTENQINGLNSIRQRADIRLGELTKDMDKRIRSYQTLGLCAGAAIAILFV